jgi:hypothetical protein
VEAIEWKFRNQMNYKIGKKNMDEIKIRELVGANMDIDLVSDNVDWNQSVCPWNKVENTKEHKCAVKDTSICKYFCGIKYMDSVLCSYPNENKDALN